MKKITALFLSIALVFAFSSCSNNETTVFMGEGKMTVLRNLISTNLFIADEVMGDNHLPIDESNIITLENGTFAPVVSDRIASYSALETLLKSVYVEEVANELLTQPQKYIEIDGKLYFDMQYHNDENKIKYDRNTIETEYKSTDENGTHTITVKLKTAKGRNAAFKVKAIENESNFRLCDLCN